MQVDIVGLVLLIFIVIGAIWLISKGLPDLFLKDHHHHLKNFNKVGGKKLK